MDMSNFAMLVAFIAFAWSVFGVIVEVYSIRIFQRRFDERAKWYEERGDVGEQIGSWLLYRENEGEPSNLDVMSDAFAHRLVTGMRAQVAGMASGDSRRANMVQNKVFEYIASQNPDVEFARKIGAKLGFEDEDLDLVIQALRKFGVGNIGEALPIRSTKSSNAFNLK